MHMKTLLKSLSAFALVTALSLVFAVPAHANNTATQDATNTLNCTATSGDYGQSTNNCYIVNKQNISQVENRSMLFHAPVNTGVDQTAMVAGMGAILSTGAGA